MPKRLLCTGTYTCNEKDYTLAIKSVSSIVGLGEKKLVGMDLTDNGTMIDKRVMSFVCDIPHLLSFGCA
jgi:hypothetical protein